MILIDNFKQIPNWPTYGFLYGNNIFEKQVFDFLNAYDFDQCPITDPAFPNRKAISSDNAKNIDSNLNTVLASLKEYAKDVNIIETLIERSFTDSDKTINRFWTSGIDSIKNLYKNVFIQFVEDKPNLSMSPHADHREVLCNIQVYISPNIPEIGTKFFKAGDYSQFKIAPFVPNSGYFSLNTHESIHGVHNTSNQNRKSIIISWTM